MTKPNQSRKSLPKPKHTAGRTPRAAQAATCNAVLRGEVWWLERNGMALRTPGGHRIGTTDHTLAAEAAAACQLHGDDPTTEWSMYALLCTYLDFGPQREGCIANILDNLPADPLLRMADGAVWTKRLLGPGGSSSFSGSLRAHLEARSTRHVMATTYFCAHWDSPLIAQLYFAGLMTTDEALAYLSENRMVWPFPPKEAPDRLPIAKAFAAVPDDLETVRSS